MGSDDKAVITGFICRLCSRMNRFVVHIYGDEGLQMQLAQKINVYLPITVNPNDPLPKTVCLHCIDSLEAQHQLMEQFKWARQRLEESKNQAAQARERLQRSRLQQQSSPLGPPPSHIRLHRNQESDSDHSGVRRQSHRSLEALSQSSPTSDFSLELQHSAGASSEP